MDSDEDSSQFLNLTTQEDEFLKDDILLTTSNLPFNKKQDSNKNQGSFMLPSDSKTDNNKNQGTLIFFY